MSYCCLSLDSYIKPQHIWSDSFNMESCLSLDSYIKPQLPMTALAAYGCCLSLDSYIKPQLYFTIHLTFQRCLSLDSYIKPQLNKDDYKHQMVVYLLIPTSNHNWHSSMMMFLKLFISWFLHQTTTYRGELADNQLLAFTLTNKKWRIGRWFRGKNTKKSLIG